MNKKEKINEEVINWLLEDNTPGVRTRTLVGLCGFSDKDKVVREARRTTKESLDAARDLSWMTRKGQILVYNLTAVAESGLSYEDINIEPVIDKLLLLPFDAGCGDLMTLRAMVMLGFGNDHRVTKCLAQMKDTQLPDGAWLCLHRLRKMDRIPKSCIKVAMHGLLLASELKKRGIEIEGTERLVNYFLERRLFFRRDNPMQLVLNRPGRRMTEVFFPIEYFYVGLPVLLEALAVLGAGRAQELEEAWILLDKKKDNQGKIMLEGTLPANKSYLSRERIGKPSKWGTLYSYLAWKNR